jgi:hypothetical protein
MDREKRKISHVGLGRYRIGNVKVWIGKNVVSNTAEYFVRENRWGR